MNVWLVWTGRDSDAYVDCVCDSREAAEVMAAKIEDGYVDPEDGYRVLPLAEAEAKRVETRRYPMWAPDRVKDP